MQLTQFTQHCKLNRKTIADILTPRWIGPEISSAKTTALTQSIWTGQPHSTRRKPFWFITPVVPKTSEDSCHRKPRWMRRGYHRIFWTIYRSPGIASQICAIFACQLPVTLAIFTAWLLPLWTNKWHHSNQVEHSMGKPDRISDW